ncbi:hypothetical protein [Rhodopseudomonas sp. RCAM05734]|uniref:hypothetical protein n=1 Tax=Rhodopseudomonas sp. RCAM05734 TaxID=3457549 RepID=UPI004043D1B9
MSAEERDAFLNFIKLNTALWSIEDSVLPAIDTKRIVLVDLLSHDLQIYATRAILIAKMLQKQHGFKLVGLIGNLVFSRDLEFNYQKEDAIRLAESFGITEFFDLEDPASIFAHGLSGQFTEDDTSAAVRAIHDSADEDLADAVLRQRTADGCRIGEYIFETAIRVARNPFLTDVRPQLEAITREAHHIHNIVRAACKSQQVEAFISGHLSYTQWGMTADIILRGGGKAIWFDTTGNFSAYLLTRPPAGEETLDSQIRQIDKVLFESEFQNRGDLDPQFAAKVRLLFSSDYFLRPFWFEPAKSPPAALAPVLRKIALQKLGWPNDPRPVVCVFFHCLSDLPRDDEQIYLDYYVWIVETLKIAVRDTSKNWIFKTHPSNRGVYDVTNATERLKEEHQGHQNIFFLENELQKMELYSVCDLAVTVRGSISYEMSVFGKPSLLAGRSVLSDLGFCHVANTAEEYEELLTKKFATLTLSKEMQERANFFLIYDKIICRLESTFMPYWTYQITGNNSIWNALSERILYNVSDLDPVASAILAMFNGGPPRTINTAYRQLMDTKASRRAPTADLAAQDPFSVARIDTGETVSFGLEGRGALALLSKPARLDKYGSRFAAGQSASIGFVLSQAAGQTNLAGLALGLHLFTAYATGQVYVSVNGERCATIPLRGSGSRVEIIEIGTVLTANPGACIIDVFVMLPSGAMVPFRVDAMQIAPLSELRRYPTHQPFFGFVTEKDGEREFAWMPQTVALTMPPDIGGKQLRLAGYLPYAMHRDKNQISYFTVDVLVNGQRIDTIRASADRVFELSVDLDDSSPGDDGTVRVDLRANSVLPAENDGRQLSFIVTEMSVQ